MVFVPFPYCGERLGHRLVENLSHIVWCGVYHLLSPLMNATHLLFVPSIHTCSSSPRPEIKSCRALLSSCPERVSSPVASKLVIHFLSKV